MTLLNELIRTENELMFTIFILFNYYLMHCNRNILSIMIALIIPLSGTAVNLVNIMTNVAPTLQTPVSLI